MKLDIIVDLQYGDCGKGRETVSRLKKNKYDWVAKCSGGSNAGHSVIHASRTSGRKEKTVLHLLPMGLLFDVRSIIGPGCVLNPDVFFQEVEELEKQHGIDRKLIKIAHNAHIITKEHLEIDGRDEKIGTTKRGIGPCQSDRYFRRGLQAKDVSELQPFIVNFVDVMWEKRNSNILVEGSQGIFLDPFYGEFPYITSCHCSVGGVLANGFSWKDVNEVVGVIKPYQTYVGNKQMEKLAPIFEQIRNLGKERGSTTNRPRQVFYLNPNSLVKAANVSGITSLVVNKMDILKELDHWVISDGVSKVNLKTEDNFKNYLQDLVKVPITYNYSPEVN